MQRPADPLPRCKPLCASRSPSWSGVRPASHLRGINRTAGVPPDGATLLSLPESVKPWQTCPSKVGCSVNEAKMLAALEPFFVVEDLRRQLDQPGQHIEHRHRTPLRALARAKSLAVEFLGHLHQRNIL